MNNLTTLQMVCMVEKLMKNGNSPNYFICSIFIFFFFSFYHHTAHFYSVIVCLYYKFPIFNNVMKKLKFSISWKSALYSNICILVVKREKYFFMKHIPNIILFPSFFQSFFLIECQMTTDGKMEYLVSYTSMMW